MDNSNSHYYAWIPTLTNGFSLEKGLEHINEYYNKKDNSYISKEPHIEKDIKNRAGLKFYIEIILDASGKKIEGVQFFNQDNKTDNKTIICSGDIKFFPNLHNTLTGLIEIHNIKINEEYIEKSVENIEKDEIIKTLEKKNFIREIYVCVRDIYHKHTHHDDSHDLQLDIVESSDIEGAIKEIINQYENKLNKHILQMKDIYEIYKYTDASLSDVDWYDKFIFVTGEMIYAQRFIELHEGKLPADKEYLTFQFKHGETILNNYKEVINEKIESQRNKQILKLTYIGTIMGAIVGTILSVDALHNLGFWEPTPLQIMLVISTLIVFSLVFLRSTSIKQ